MKSKRMDYLDAGSTSLRGRGERELPLAPLRPDQGWLTPPQLAATQFYLSRQDKATGETLRDLPDDFFIFA